MFYFLGQNFKEVKLKKSVFLLLVLFLSLSQSYPVQASLVLSPSNLSVFDTTTGNSWYRFFDDFYFGSIYGAGPGTPTYILNDENYDGKNNWALASVEQIKTMLTSIPTTSTGPADISNLFINAPWERGGGHYNPDWSIGPLWSGITSTEALYGDGSVIPNQHIRYTLAYYKSYNGSDSYYTESYSDTGDSTSGSWGSWLVAINTSPVPVPTTIFLLGSGILGLAGVSRRKK